MGFTDFRIIDGEIDGVEETAGIEITNILLTGFPRGILAVRNGYNYDAVNRKASILS